MERRNEIRAAIHSLLTPHTSAQRELSPNAICATVAVSPAAVPESHAPVLEEIQEALRSHGVVAETTELHSVLLDELFKRPYLCQGLIASYLLGE